MVFARFHLQVLCMSFASEEKMVYCFFLCSLLRFAFLAVLGFRPVDSVKMGNDRCESEKVCWLDSVLVCTGACGSH